MEAPQGQTTLPPHHELKWGMSGYFSCQIVNAN